MNRFTGKRDFGERSENSISTVKKDTLLSLSEVGKIEIAAKVLSNDYCYVDVYNGSDWTLSELTFEVYARKFKIRPSAIRPLSATEVSFYIGDIERRIIPFTYRIYEAKGFRGE